MNNNIDNTNDSTNHTPYRATSNFNTNISNPTMNINNTMDVNIQSTGIPNNNQVKETPINTSEENINSSPITQQNQTPNVTRTFIPDPPKAKKKTVTFNIGPEFKIALLITVILLIFTFILPLLTKLIRGY